MNIVRFFVLFLLVLNFIQGINNKYDECLINLERLEGYAKEYHKLNNTLSLNTLILNYIRSERYNSEEWILAGGVTPEKFIEYVETKDSEQGYTTKDLRSYSDIDIILPDASKNGTYTDFVHMFASMSGIENNNHSFTAFLTALTGWGGDLAELFKDISIYNGTLDELIQKAREILEGKKSGGFSQKDLIADLDAVNYMNLRFRNPQKSFANILKDYVVNLNITKRLDGFISKTFQNLANNKVNNSDYRNTIYKQYDNNSFIKVLECKYNLREGQPYCVFPGSIKEGKEINRKAAIYAFADYLYENKPVFSDSSSSYIKFYGIICLIALLLI